MDLDSLAKLGEFIGGFFVIVSLVYLAHQVRQNTKSLRAENYARRCPGFVAGEALLPSEEEIAAVPDQERPVRRLAR